MATESPITDADWQGEKLPRTQEKYLRAFDECVSWFARPPKFAKCPEPEDFSRWVHARMLHILDMRNVPELRGQDLSFARRATRHICYKVLLQSVSCFTHATKPDIVIAAVHQDLDVIKRGKVLPIRHPHHPLAAEKHRLRETPYGKVIEATVPDRNMAGWMMGKPLETLVHNLPEITQPSPDVRLTIYAKNLRCKLRALFTSTLTEQEIRRRASEMILEEWLVMAEAANTYEKAHEGATTLGLNGIVDGPLQEVAPKLRLSQLITSPQREELANPLLQQLTLRMMIEDDTKNLSTLSNEWADVLLRFRIPACDRPAMSLAILVAMVNDPTATIRQLRDKI